MPRLLDVINPKAEGGAVQGYGVPLASDATKQDLNEPIKRGIYALSSENRKTVLKMMVMPREEAGFDPAVIGRSELAKSWEPEVRLRVESTWMVMQLTFESYDPLAYPALDFLLTVAKRLAELTDGAIADPISQVYRLPSQVLPPRPANVPVLASDHVSVRTREKDGAVHAYTAGLTKLDHPEVEITGIGEAHKETAERFLMALAQTVLLGTRLEPGAIVGETSAPLKVATGGLDRGMWEGIPCFELIPEVKSTVDEALLAWAARDSGSA